MQQLEEKALFHQTTAARQMAKVKSAILADEMGLGKTFTSILFLYYSGVSKFLYAAPKEVTSNLKDEIAKWTNIPIIDVRSKTKAQRQTILNAVKILDRYIVLVNLEAWSRDKDLIADIISLQLQAVVVDEGHHLNNTKTSLFKGVREITYASNQCPNCFDDVTPKYKCNRKGCESDGALNRFRYCMSCGHQQSLVTVPDCGCGEKIKSSLLAARSVKYVVVMTGTPIINKPGDLWPILYLVNDKKFPTPQKFADNYLTVVGGKVVFQDGAQERLVRDMGAQYIQRNRKDAGIRLPPQSIEVLEYDQDRIKYRDQWAAYDQVEKMFALQLEDEMIPLTEIVVQITRLRQMLTWPMGIQIKDDDGSVLGHVDVEHSQKLDIVESKIREYLDCGHRVVAFSHFKAPLRELQRRLGDQAAVYDGDTDQATRKALRDDFGAAHRYPRWSTLLCNYRSAGESLTLIGANDIIVIDPDWSPAKNKQAFGRIDRLGQTQETRVHIPRITKTVDIWMAELNGFKESMSAEFLSLANYQSEILKAIRARR